MSLAWAAGAVVFAAAGMVHGLAGFGFGLVALAFLPFLMPPATAVVLVTSYAALFALIVFLPLRRDGSLPRVTDLVVGTLLGTPLGVWALAALPGAALRRIIGAVLVTTVVVEWRGLYPRRLDGRGWGVGAGFLAGLLGSAVGIAAPPVVLYAAARGWGPRAMKANILAFLLVNQTAILVGYWWTRLLTAEVGRLALAFGVPVVAGVAAGMALFDRIDAAGFRRVVFGLVLASGLVLLGRG